MLSKLATLTHLYLNDFCLISVKSAQSTSTNEITEKIGLTSKNTQRIPKPINDQNVLSKFLILTCHAKMKSKDTFC